MGKITLIILLITIFITFIYKIPSYKERVTDKIQRLIDFALLNEINLCIGDIESVIGKVNNRWQIKYYHFQIYHQNKRGYRLLKREWLRLNGYVDGVTFSWDIKSNN